MGVYLHNGKILLEGGKVAVSADCCCDGGGCCGCAWLDAFVADALEHGCVSGKGRLKVTVSGAGFSGYVILGPDPGGEGFCIKWASDLECGDITNLVNDCGYVISAMEFYCLTGGTEISQFKLIFNGLTSGGCDFDDPTFVSGSCGPPLSLTYQTEAVDTSGIGDCPPECTGTITFTVENLDPWPLP